MRYPKVMHVEVSARAMEKIELQDFLLCPSPRKTVAEDESGMKSIQEEYQADAGIYGTNALFPGHLAEAEVAGYLRDQRVASIMFYPVQYNPVTRLLEVHKKIRVSLRFKLLADSNGKTAGMEQPDVSTSAAAGEKIFDRIYASSLLNYRPGEESARALQQQRSAVSLQAQNTHSSAEQPFCGESGGER